MKTLGATAIVWLLGAAWAGGQAAPEPKPQMAEEVFKNVQLLKGIPFKLISFLISHQQ